MTAELVNDLNLAVAWQLAGAAVMVVVVIWAISVCIVGARADARAERLQRRRTPDAADELDRMRARRERALREGNETAL